MNHLKFWRSRKILFIGKTRQVYGVTCPQSASTGLCESVAYLVRMLTARHVAASAVFVVDNNDIDRVVTQVRPTVVVIEALWVVPQKFEVLRKRHPGVTWIVRLHSELPFLSGEGVALEWLHEYMQHPGVLVGCNSDRLADDLRQILPQDRVLYLPNHYPLPQDMVPKPVRPKVGRIQIASFGAIRPLKNQLAQAVAALEFGHQVGNAIDFHINALRVEGGGEPVLRNLRSLFAGSGMHRLIEHPWLSSSNFTALVRSMDMGMQVSLSETFNLVTADFVGQGVPVVGSEEIRWLPLCFKTDPHSSQAISAKLEEVWTHRFTYPMIAFDALETSNERAEAQWMTTLARAEFQHG
jgi:glycosyltransferase involved in cell wall biosynthesis